MQFGCDSCKTQLQIADEKVRGKRLIVRCKRCGAKIAISDPALAKTPPRMVAPPPSKPPRPAAASAPARAAPAAAPRGPNSDTESTRAMETDVLEKALQASKADDPAAVQNGAPPPSRPPPPADTPTWFAMLHGKQEGPLTRVQLDEKTGRGEMGPRTYLWKDGMESWQRAKDLPELAELFPAAAAPSVPPPPPIPLPPSVSTPFSTSDFVVKAEAPRPATPAPAAAHKEGNPTPVAQLPLGERVYQDDVAGELFAAETSEKSAADLAQWASAELGRKPPPKPAASVPARAMFESAAPTRSGSGPFALFVGLAILGAAGVAMWLIFGGTPEKKDEPPKPSQQAQVGPARPEAVAPVKAEQAAPPPAAAKPPPPAEKPAPPPPSLGLTADQVRRKLDENKSALQTCIDEALRRDPSLRVGKIHIATTIAPSGQVTTAKIDKRIVDESPLGGCLKRATRRIAFPAFRGDAFEVDIPIVVTAGE